MVLGSDLAVLGGFGYAAVQVVGKVLRLAKKSETRKTDHALLNAWDQFLDEREAKMLEEEANDIELAKNLKAAGAPDEECSASRVFPCRFGRAAHLAAQGHVMAEWCALSLQQRVSLLEDLAELAVWAGIGAGETKRGASGGAGAALRAASAAGGSGRVVWSSLSDTSKQELLAALDAHLDFRGLEDVRQEAPQMAASWLWQVTESLPLLGDEPEHTAAAEKMVAGLRERFSPMEKAVFEALDVERKLRLDTAVTAVGEMDVTAMLGKVESLRSLLPSLGLDSAGATASIAEQRRLLQSLDLTPEDPTVVEEKAQAVLQLKAEVDAKVEAERASGSAAADAKADLAYRTRLVSAASAPRLWVQPTATPGTALQPASAFMTQRVALVELLLEHIETAAVTSDAAATAAASAAAAAGSAAAEVEAAKSAAAVAEHAVVEQAAADHAAAEAAVAEVLASVKAVADILAAQKAAEATAAAATASAGAQADGAAAEGTDVSEPPSLEECAGEAAEVSEEEATAAAATAAAEAQVAAAAVAEAEAAATAARQLAEEKAAAAAQAISEQRSAAQAVIASMSATAAAAASASSKAAAAAKTEVAVIEQLAKGVKDLVSRLALVEGDELKAELAALSNSGGSKERADRVRQLLAPAVAAKRVADVDAAIVAGVVSRAFARVLAPPAPVVEAPLQAVEQTVVAAVEEEVAAADAVSAEVEGAAVSNGEVVEQAEGESEVLEELLQDAIESVVTENGNAVAAIAAEVAAAEAQAAAEAAATAAQAEADAAASAAAESAEIAEAVSNLVAAALVRVSVTGEAREHSEAVKAQALSLLATRLVSLAQSSLADAQVARYMRRDSASLGERLMAVEIHAKGVSSRQLPPLPALTAASAVDLLKPDEAAMLAMLLTRDGVALLPESRASLTRVLVLRETVALCKAVAKLELGPGVNLVLGKVATYIGEQDVERGVCSADALMDGKALCEALRGNGLVVLELQPLAYRQLQSLRLTTEALAPEGDALVYKRGLSTLKDLLQHLGGILQSADARVSQVTPTQQSLISTLRTSAVAMYNSLIALLQLELEGIKADAKAALSSAKETVYGIKVEKKSETLQNGCSNLAAMREVQIMNIVKCLKQLAKWDVAMEELKAVISKTIYTTQALDKAASYLRLREHALGLHKGALSPREDETLVDINPYVPELLDRMLELNDPAPEEEEEAPDAPQQEERKEIASRLSGWIDLVDEEQGGENGDEERRAEAARWRMEGYKQLSRGQVALVTITGGTIASGEIYQSADINLPSAKSLMQFQAERILKLQQLAAEAITGRNSGVANPIQWYLVVLPAHLPQFTAFLSSHKYFGLDPKQVTLVPNTVAPPNLTENFKVVTQDGEGKISRSRPGSGEVFLALRRNNTLAAMARAGVTAVEIQSVEDNLPSLPLEPGFIGYCHTCRHDSAAKVLDADCITMESVFNGYAHLAGPMILPSLQNLAPATGTYYFTVDYLRHIERTLVSSPMINYRMVPGSYTDKGAVTQGYRMDRRLSDFVLPGSLAQDQGLRPTSALVLVRAPVDFSVVFGVAPFMEPEAPCTAVDDLLLQHTNWVENAGAIVGPDPELSVVEVSPLVSYEGEGLGFVEGREFNSAYEADLQGLAPGAASKTTVGAWVGPFAIVYAAAAAVKLLTKK